MVQEQKVSPCGRFGHIPSAGSLIGQLWHRLLALTQLSRERWAQFCPINPAGHGLGPGWR